MLCARTYCVATKSSAIAFAAPCHGRIYVAFDLTLWVLPTESRFELIVMAILFLASLKTCLTLSARNRRSVHPNEKLRLESRGLYDGTNYESICVRYKEHWDPLSICAVEQPSSSMQLVEVDKTRNEVSFFVFIWGMISVQRENQSSPVDDGEVVGRERFPEAGRPGKTTQLKRKHHAWCLYV